jgi:hypothetical protein
MWILLYFVAGFLWLKFDEHFGGWINMIAYNFPMMALGLYVLSLILWPLHVVNSSLEWYRDWHWRKTQQ